MLLAFCIFALLHLLLINFVEKGSASLEEDPL